MRRIALKYGVVDTPNQPHKSHAAPVPYLGGVALVVSTVSLTVAATLFSEFGEKNFRLLSTILLPGLIMAFIGLIDDIKQLRPWPRFLVQNFVALLSVAVLIDSKTLGTPTGLTILDVIVSIIWLVGITNAINFFDNLDGGASGTIAISSLVLTYMAFLNGQILIAAMSVVVSGATVGFLIWNKPPAKIYMGDAGALFLGLIMASLLIRFDPIVNVQIKSFFILIFLMAVPILDTSVAILGRINRGVSPFTGGRDHLSHRIMSLGVSRRLTVLLLWGLTAYFALISALIFLSVGDFSHAILLTGIVSWLVLFFTFFFMKCR
jgi:UDP-GlcNAc:undecaprenyl-phosphate GlcNAc-1-phosphate transferase